MAGGMGWFDAVCQMFAAIGTGGFSTKNTSIAGFHSAYIDWVIIVFLWVASTNFALWWAVLGGKPKRLLKDPEWRFYTARAARLQRRGRHAPLPAERRRRCTTPSATRPSWSSRPPRPPASPRPTTRSGLPLSQFIIFMLLFMGGCAGSTAGAMKAVRVLLFAKQAVARALLDRAPAGGRLAAPRRAAGAASRPCRASRPSWACTCSPGSSPPRGSRSPTSTSPPPRRRSRRPWAASDRVSARSARSTTSCGCTPPPRPSSRFCMLAGRLEIVTLMLIFVPAYWRR